jgi:hypothetical protein
MNLPFSPEQFLQVFSAYNTAIWPGQIFLNGLAFLAIVLSFKGAATSKLISGILAFLWAWTGVAYHLAFFASINKAAFLFSILCVVQALLFCYAGILKGRLIYQPTATPVSHIGSLLILYSLLIYPVLGYFLGHIYPQSPTFGAPCPTTIFTFGFLLWTAGNVPRFVIIIPALWCLVGTVAAFSLGIREDLGLLLAGVIAVPILFLRKHSVGIA